MQRPNNLKVGEKFKVIEGGDHYNLGEIVTLEDDDGSSSPYFLKADNFHYSCINFSKLEPYTKTIRDAQVGDVVVGKYNNEGERMVLERGQNTVVLSYGYDFKKADVNYHFDELEEYFTLKDAPDVKSAKIAEAIELLKKAGYKITKE